MTEPRIPTFQATSMTCKCGHSWTGYLPMNVEVHLWVAHGKAIYCPKCLKGPKGVLLNFGQMATT